MNSRYNLSSLSDHDLVTELARVVRIERQVLADVLAHLAELDDRKLYRIYGCSSTFAYCTEMLAMTDHEALSRIRAARIARQWPYVFDDIAGGQLSLSGVNIVAARVKDDDALLRKARGKTTRQIRALKAAAHPEPDVPDSIKPIAADRVEVRFSASMGFRDKIERARSLLSHRFPDGRLEDLLERGLDLAIAHAEKTRFAATDKPRPAKRRCAKPAQASPTAATAPESVALPPCVDAAGGDDPSRTRYLEASVRREVVARDEERCTYVGINGRRCGARAFLQFHHDNPHGKGGGNGPGNLRLLCATHNDLLAEQEYGRAHMATARAGKLGTHRVQQAATPGPAADSVGQLGTHRVQQAATPGPAADSVGQLGTHRVQPPSSQVQPADDASTLLSDPRADAISALVNLDFKPALARRAVLAAAADFGPNPSFDQLIRASLRRTRTLSVCRECRSSRYEPSRSNISS